MIIIRKHSAETLQVGQSVRSEKSENWHWAMGGAHDVRGC